MSTDVWRRGGLEFKVRAAKWVDAQHPRDRNGKFIQVGAAVKLSALVEGLKTGEIVDPDAGNNTVIVKRPDGSKIRVHRRYVTVQNTPSGGKPASKPDEPQPPHVAEPSKPSTAPAKTEPKAPAKEAEKAAPPKVEAPKDGGENAGLTAAQKLAISQGWKKLPAGTVAELQTQLAAVKVADTPSTLDLIDGGMDPAKAAKEANRLARNAKVNEWRARNKLQAAIDNLIAKDGKAGQDVLDKHVDGIEVSAAAKPKTKTKTPAKGGPKVDVAVAADMLAKPGDKPTALYDAVPGQTPGPGGSKSVAWFDRIRVMGEADGPIPVHGLTIGGHTVKAGWAVRRAGMSYLVEQRAGETPEQAMGRLEEYRKVVEPVMAGVPKDKGMQLAMRGAALLEAANPSDAHWAKTYNTPGFKSAATGGDGSMTAWGGQVPAPPVVAHELGHNIDKMVNFGGPPVSTSSTVVMPNQKLTWNSAALRDELSSAAWDGRFKETRVGGHPITPGKEGVSGYGENSRAEDFAESVRLWLKDRREGKIGYDPTTGDNLRFSDLFPERARILDEAFGSKLDHTATPAHQRRRAEAEQHAYDRLPKTGPAGHVPDPGKLFGTLIDGQQKFGLPRDVLREAGVAAIERWAKDHEAAKAAAAAAAKAEADAKAEAEAAAKQYETVKAALEAGLLDKGTSGKLRARVRAAKFHAKEKGASEAEAVEIAAAYERALIQKWLAENKGKQGGGTAGGGAQPWKDAKLSLPELAFNAKDPKADAYVFSGGDTKHPLAHSQPGNKPGQAKANIVAELGSRLNNEQDWAALQTYAKARFNLDVGTYDQPFAGSHLSIALKLSPGLTPEQRRQRILDSVTSTVVQQWAANSGDSREESVMMQKAAGEEFGISAHPSPMQTPENYKKLIAGYEARKAFLRRLARVQYQHTQEDLKKAGITHVTVYRGMGFSAHNRPAWAKDGKHTPQFQPINSWSSRPGVAAYFGNTFFHAKVPAELIFGSARTGFGCQNEWEYVVLDAPGSTAQVYEDVNKLGVNLAH